MAETPETPVADEDIQVDHSATATDNPVQGVRSTSPEQKETMTGIKIQNETEGFQFAVLLKALDHSSRVPPRLYVARVLPALSVTS